MVHTVFDIRGSDGQTLERGQAMPSTVDQLLPESRGLTSKWLILTQRLFILQEKLLEGSELQRSDCKAGFNDRVI